MHGLLITVIHSLCFTKMFLLHVHVGVTVSFDISNVTISEGDSSTVQVVLSGIPSGGLEIDVEVDILTIDRTGEGSLMLDNYYCYFSIGSCTKYSFIRLEFLYFP